MIEATLRITLVSPYEKSLEYIYDMIALWDVRVLKSSTLSSKARISMPAHKFKDLFATNPRKGKYDPPKGTESFIEGVEVLEVETA